MTTLSYLITFIYVFVGGLLFDKGHIGLAISTWLFCFIMFIDTSVDSIVLSISKSKT